MAPELPALELPLSVSKHLRLICGLREPRNSVVHHARNISVSNLLFVCVWSTESDVAPAGGNGPSTQLWSCSFEQSDNALCGMTQEQSRDQFDWTVHSGSTPSNPTGPDFAHHGSFYAYIEASNPRRPNDEAW